MKKVEPEQPPVPATSDNVQHNPGVPVWIRKTIGALLMVWTVLFLGLAAL